MKPSWINHQYALVRIDKAQQTIKRTKTDSGVYLPPAFIYMKYNLQWGTIEMLGDGVKRLFPEAAVGDIAILHHLVESNQTNRWVGTEPNGDELRLAEVNPENGMRQIFGVVKEDGELIPYKDWVFFDKNMTTLKKKYFSDLVITTDQDMWDDEAFLHRELVRLGQERDWLAETLTGYTQDQYKDAEQVMDKIALMDNQRERVSTYLNAERVAEGTALYIPPFWQRVWGAHPGMKMIVRRDTLYPLSFGGNEFSLSLSELVYGHRPDGSIVPLP
jgi:hypothetical protein